jgi:AcrR family transcriptional regulator
MAAKRDVDVRPNRRGVQSREAVLDAAERLMARRGYDGATLAAIVEDSGIPPSSVYHYFGSKDGILLAVMERGAERFFAELIPPAERLGAPIEHLQLVVAAVAQALERHPEFLRLLVTFAALPRPDSQNEVTEVVNRVRGVALSLWRGQLALVFELSPRARVTDQAARFALAAIDGAFIAIQTEPKLKLGPLLAPLPGALARFLEASQLTTGTPRPRAGNKRRRPAVASAQE